MVNPVVHCGYVTDGVGTKRIQFANRIKCVVAENWRVKPQKFVILS